MTSAGERYFERDLAVARRQSAKTFQLCAAMSMARLWRDRGKREEARDLLAPVYGPGYPTLLQTAECGLCPLGEPASRRKLSGFSSATRFCKSDRLDNC
jgi:hypothetical protein